MRAVDDSRSSSVAKCRISALAPLSDRRRDGPGHRSLQALKCCYRRIRTAVIRCRGGIRTQHPRPTPPDSRTWTPRNRGRIRASVKPGRLDDEANAEFASRQQRINQARTPKRSHTPDPVSNGFHPHRTMPLHCPRSIVSVSTRHPSVRRERSLCHQRARGGDGSSPPVSDCSARSGIGALARDRRRCRQRR